MAACEWPGGCLETGTHSVTIAFPNTPAEAWLVCRSHDRALKYQAITSRGPAPAPPPTPVAVALSCRKCGAVLDQSAQRPEGGEAPPCPHCGSNETHITIGISETMGFKESLRIRTKEPGKGGWIVESRSGDDYTRLLESWGRRELTTDRRNNTYREVVELHDGTRVESTAALRDHRN